MQIYNFFLILCNGWGVFVLGFGGGVMWGGWLRKKLRGGTILLGWGRYLRDENNVAYHGVAGGVPVAGLWGRGYGMPALLLFGEGEYPPAGRWLLQPGQRLHGCAGVAGVGGRYCPGSVAAGCGGDGCDECVQKRTAIMDAANVWCCRGMAMPGRWQSARLAVGQLRGVEGLTISLMCYRVNALTCDCVNVWMR